MVLRPLSLFESALCMALNEHIIRRASGCNFPTRSAPIEMRNPRNSDESESVLIKRTADGDRDAFKELYARYHRRLFAYLLKLLSERGAAEEVLNDVMFEVWRQAGNFKGQSKLATWIFGIAHHKALNARRQKGSQALVDIEEADALEQTQYGPQAVVEQSDASAKIKAALKRLSEEHRAVIELTFYHGFSYQEIAHIVNCPVGTVKTRMFHARRQLRDMLHKMGLG